MYNEISELATISLSLAWNDRIEPEEITEKIRSIAHKLHQIALKDRALVSEKNRLVQFLAHLHFIGLDGSIKKFHTTVYFLRGFYASLSDLLSSYPRYLSYKRRFQTFEDLKKIQNLFEKTQHDPVDVMIVAQNIIRFHSEKAQTPLYIPHPHFSIYPKPFSPIYIPPKPLSPIIPIEEKIKALKLNPHLDEMIDILAKDLSMQYPRTTQAQVKKMLENI